MNFNVHPSYILPAIISGCAHLLLAVLVAWGWQVTQTPKTVTPRYVPATLVSLKATTVQQRESQAKNKVIDLTAKKREQERLAKEKQQQEAKSRQIKEKQEQERKIKEQNDKARKLKEQQAAQAKAKAAEEKKRQEDARRKKMEADLAAALAGEEEFLQAESDEATAQSYIALIAARVEQNWSRPPSARTGMQCELLIQLVPTGKVVNVSVVRGSGNAAFDRSAEQAVIKAERFPELQNMPPDVFERNFRQLRLVFNPKDLRL